MTTLLTLSWQREPTANENMKKLHLVGIFYVALGGILLYLARSNEYRTFGYIGIAIGLYCILKYCLMPSARKVPALFECSLQVTTDGLLYTINSVKRFFLFKEINTIKTEQGNVILKLDHFQNDAAGADNLIIPNSAFTASFSKEMLLEKLLQNLPDANKIDPSLPLPPPPKTSYLFVYIGFALMLLFLVLGWLVSQF